jgi:hypothetical protein
MVVVAEQQSGSEDPLLILSLSKLTADLADWSTAEMRGLAQMTIKIDYYNEVLEEVSPLCTSGAFSLSSHFIFANSGSHSWRAGRISACV